MLATTSLPAQSESGDSVEALRSGLRLPDVLAEGTLRPKTKLWFSDKDGNLVFVPEETLDEYLKSTSQPAGEEIPSASLSASQIRVEIEQDIARVECEFSLLLSKETATSIDLGLGNVQLSQWSFTGGASHNAVRPNADGLGWQWIVMGNQEADPQASLKGVTRVARDSDRRSVAFVLPPAPTTIRLKLPPNAADVRVRSEDILDRELDSASDEVTVQSAGGEFTISWRDRESLSKVAAVEATSETEFFITDPTNPWRATTTITLRWYGREASNRVTISLPPGSLWQSVPNSEFERFRITTVEDNPEESGTENEGSRGARPARLLLENFDTSQPVTVPLEWEWSPLEEGAERLPAELPIQTALIEGVDRHEGTLDFLVPSAYTVVFKEGAAVQWIQQGAVLDTLRQQLQFEFDRQDFKLGLSFRRDQSLPMVRPTYVVHIDRNRLVMTMWFDCSFDKNQQQMELGLILDEWLIQENTARILSDPSQPFSGDGEILRVRQQVDRNYVISGASLDPGAYGSGRHVDQVWRVVAERAWTSDENNELFFRLPKIVRGRAGGNPETDHGSGALLVTSDSNILLKWQEAAGTGLQRDSFSNEYEPYVRQAKTRNPLAYRFQSSGETPLWAGRAELLPQQVSVEQHVDVEVIPSEIAIRQNYELQVANEPLEEMSFAIRSQQAEFQSPLVYINGDLTTTRILGSLSEQQNAVLDSEKPAASGEATQASRSSESDWLVYQVVGGPQVLGATRITILSSAPWTWSPTNGGESGVTAVTVPLVRLLVPPGTRAGRQDWTLRTASQIEAVNPSGGGMVREAGGEQALRPLADAQDSIDLQLRPRQLATTAAVRINRSWLRTEVNGRHRRDRFVAQVEGASGTLQVRLPALADIRDKTKVAIDGVEQPYQYDPETDTMTLVIPSDRTQRHVVELSYFLPDYLAWMSKMEVAPPVIVGAERSERFYWQLVTPSVQHLAWSPKELTAEWTWQWTGIWWSRKSQWDQAQLETWIGTGFQEPLPASANVYVMSGLGPDHPVTVWVLSRLVLWFPVGLLAVALSFAVLNFALFRHPAFVFALAVGVGGLAMVWPDMAVLVGQTSAFSIGLVALVLVMQAAIDTRVRRRSVFSTRPSTYIDRSEYTSHARIGRSTQSTPSRAAGSSVGAHEG